MKSDRLDVMLGLLALLGVLLTFGAYMVSEYLTYLTLDRALTTMDNAVNAGVITKEDFMKEMDELAAELSGKKKEK